MRNFAYKNPDYIKNEVVPELVEDNPCYQQSVYDTVMYDESLDGALIQCDGSINGTFRVSPSSWNSFQNLKISELQEIAACVFVAVGIPQEMIDSVVVE